LNKTTAGTVALTGKIALQAVLPVNITQGVLQFEPGNVPVSGAGVISIGAADASTSGVFRMTGAGAASTSRNFSINAGAIDVDNAGGTLTITSQLSGSGNLDKTGPGALVLTPAGDYHGTITAKAGVLRMTPGSAGGNVALADGATLAIASGTGATSLTLPALSLGSNGSTLSFEMNTATAPVAPPLVIGNPDSLLTNGGTHTINVTNTQVLPVGQFTLIDYNGSAISSGFKLGTLGGRTIASLVYNTANTSIDLNVQGSDSTLWNGNVSPNWDVGTAIDLDGTKNFRLASTSAATNFVAGDRVVFDDTATGATTINLAAVAQPASVVVNNSTLNYTFQGTGSIAGATGLTKQGTGTLIVATDNTYTGVTAVSGGTLQLGNGGTTGSVSGNISLDTGATLTFNRSNDVTYNGAVSSTSPVAGTIVKNGPNTLTFGGSSPFTGTVIVNQGTFLLDDNGGGGDLNASSIVINNGATFIFGEHGNPDFPDSTVVTIETGGTFDLRQGENYGGFILDGGTYVFSGTTKTGVNSTAAALLGYVAKSGTITTNFTGGSSGGLLSGTTFFNKVTPGTVTVNGSVTFGTGISMNVLEGTLSLGAVNFPADGTTSITIGDSSTPATLQLSDGGSAATVRPVAIGTGGGTVDVPNALGAVTFNGVVTGDGVLTKSGAGTLTLTAQNTFTGSVAVTGGTLDAEPVVGKPTVSSLPASVTIANDANLKVAAPNTSIAALSGAGTTTITTGGGVTVASLAQNAVSNAGSLAVTGTGTIGTLGGSGATTVGVNGGSSTASLAVNSFTQGSVTINPGASMTLAGSAPLGSLTSALAVNGTGKLDLNAGGVAINYGTGTSPLSQVQQLVAAGRNGGDWKGSGITSSLAISNKSKYAVGYGPVSDVALGAGGTFMGQVVDALNSVMVRTTYVGDGNLDGKVDVNDIRQIILRGSYNDGSTTHTWSQGDFNGDGIVDVNDIRAIILSGNYNAATFSGSAPAAGGSAQAPAATPAVTLTGGGQTATPAVSGTTLGAIGDGKLDFVYDPTTGHVKLNADGIANVAEMNLVSAGGRFLTANVASGLFTGFFDTKAPGQLDGLLLGSSFADGTDLGAVLPMGLSTTTLLSDLTLTYSLIGGGQPATADLVVTGTPEPGTIALVAVSGVGLLLRRRRSRNR
jgi:autotransporter-associated beta strand protein